MSLGRLLNLCKELGRGCDCGYDDRCSNCDRIIAVRQLTEQLLHESLTPTPEHVLMENLRVHACLDLIRKEFDRAVIKHPKPMHSPHEAHSVIREEFEEFWDEVKRQKIDPAAMEKELTQLGAMALRALVELGPHFGSSPS